MTIHKLPQFFYYNKDVVALSKSLLGKVLVTNLEKQITSGTIVETEAYFGVRDRASHAYSNKVTSRTRPMYMTGGICYIYLCYGIHYLFNVVTNLKKIPHAILIRAIEPLDGIDIMHNRRKINTKTYNLTNGPGKLSAALGINNKLNTVSLQSDKIWIQKSKIKVKKKDILSSPRIGVDYAGEDAKLPYRFYIKNNKWVSRQ